MSISIQTNVASLSAQYYISQNRNFLNTAIQQLSSGYKINSSADDPAGPAYQVTPAGAQVYSHWELADGRILAGAWTTFAECTPTSAS